MKHLKRTLILCGVTMITAGVLAGCADRASAKESKAGETQEANGKMRTVQTDKGEVEIPEDPEVIFTD